MIAIFSSSVGYAYQLLFILYRGNSPVFCYSFPSLFIHLLVKGCVVLGLLYLLRYYELNVSPDFLCYFITNLWFSSVILSNSTCVMLGRLVIVFYCATLVFTSLLFFFRTRAVCNRNPWVTAFFAGLLLAILGGCLAYIVDAFKPVLLENPASNTTTMCQRSDVNPYAAAITIIPLIYDTLIFLAITWRLSRNSYEPYTFKSGIKNLIFGDHLPVFSKILLRDGQAYYLLAFSWSMSHA